MADKLDRKTKSAIRSVIRKYVDTSEMFMAPSVFTATGVVGLTLAAVDIVTTGGLATMAWQTVAFSGGMGVAGGMGFHFLRADNHTNAAGQTFHAKGTVEKTLRTMNEKLRGAFASAMKPDAVPADKSKLQWIVDDVQADLKTLSPAFKMVAGGPNGFGAEKFEFMVEERVLGDGKKQLVSLDQKIAEMREAANTVTAPQAPVETAPFAAPKKASGFNV